MTPKNKTKEEFIKDIKLLQKRIAEFETVDIKRKQAESQQRLAYECLNLLNKQRDKTNIIRDILQLIKQHTDIEAVGIRLREGEDFPYFEQNGFSEEFVEKENSLFCYDADGKLIFDSLGKPYLECMCGNIISGRFNPKLPFFTEAGSFWTNCTTELLARTDEKDRQAYTRNYCNTAGYESVALIPLRSGDETIGLLQFNDHRRNQFTSSMINFYEGFGASIGIALDRKKIENMLQKQQEEQQIILDSVPVWIFYKDTENRFIRVNKIFAEVMGIPKEQVEGKSLFDLYPKEQAEAYWRDDKEVMASGKPKRNIVELLETKKGSLWVQTDKIPYRDAQGNIIGIIGFVIDITERWQAEIELKESHEQLQILARHLQKERETERARIAKELHDELGQTLTAIKIDYACLQKKLGLLQKPLKEEVKDLSGLIDITINTVRKLTMDLRPVMLDDLGLIPAVEWLVKGVQKRAGIKVKLTVKPARLELDPDLSLTIFRIIQEALTNVIRYARATRVQIMLRKGPDGLNLTIKDNGIGIQQKQIKSHYSLGLVGMKERVMPYGGKLEITGEKNKGTTITIFLPPLKKGKNENIDS